MRARNLKPGFFKNEELVELPCEARLLFAGLWCMADREGRLLDRPRRIKIELFPADAFDVEPLLQRLSDRGLILRYEVDGERYLQIVNFLKHQHPHKTEAPSTLPAPCNNGSSTVIVPLDNGSRPASSLNPSSLNPDSLEEKDRKTVLGASRPTSGEVSHGTTVRMRQMRGARRIVVTDEQFLELKLAYPERSGDYRWRQARTALGARLAEGHTLDEIMAGVRRYSAFCTASGRAGTEYVKQASTFLGPEKPFLLPWHAPPRAETATDRLMRTLNGSSESRIIDHETDELPAIARQ